MLAALFHAIPHRMPVCHFSAEKAGLVLSAFPTDCTREMEDAVKQV